MKKGIRDVPGFWRDCCVLNGKKDKGRPPERGSIESQTSCRQRQTFGVDIFTVVLWLSSSGTNFFINTIAYFKKSSVILLDFTTKH